MPVVASSSPNDFQKEIHLGLRIEPKAREFLVKRMEKFFFGEGSEKPKDSLPKA
jgi:Fe-S cluster biosynthesis and repair protein YggX